jgi:hypothetical protein
MRWTLNLTKSAIAVLMMVGLATGLAACGGGAETTEPTDGEAVEEPAEGEATEGEEAEGETTEGEEAEGEGETAE